MISDQINENTFFINEESFNIYFKDCTNKDIEMKFTF